MAIDSNAIIKSCQEFLKKSAERYGRSIRVQERCLEALGGNFWKDDENKKTWKIGKKPVVHHDIFNKIVNGISSPYCSSPYHTSLVDQKLEELQDSVDKFEHNYDVKNTSKKAFKRGSAVGCGFVVLGVDEMGDPMMEFASQQSSVALDASVKTPDGRDAEEGATVRWISIAKAQMDYGADVIPSNYPNKCSGLDLLGVPMWGNKKDYIQIVNYYVKQKNGVMLYKICGNKVVNGDGEFMTIDRIPIVRFAGYECYDAENGIDYNGVVQRLWDSQTAYDLTWTKMMVRMQQTLKARAVIGKSAMEGMKEYLKSMEQDDCLALAYNDQPVNGVVPKEPTITNESFNTSDLTQVLTNVRTSIPDVSGIPMEGSQNIERTATEVLTQQVNNESNVAELYDNAEAANRTIGRIVIQLIAKGVNYDFCLENGPAIITSNMKRRQELQAIAAFYPEDRKMLLAVPMAQTIDSVMAKSVEETTKANLPEGLKLVNDNSEGAAIHALNDMQKQFDVAIAKAEEFKAQAEELQRQVNELTQANADMKRQQDLDLYKFKVDTALRIQQTDFENDMERKKFLQDQSKVILEAQQSMAENQRKAGEALVKAGV